MKVLVMARSRLAARGIAAVAEQAGLPAAVVAVEEGEAVAGAADLIIFH